MTSSTLNKFSTLNDFVRTALGTKDVMEVVTDKGSFVVMSMEEYNSIAETLYLTGVPGMEDEILRASEESLDDCLPIEEIDL